jgi:uncharacterized repeat protein (TIGR03806 family)
VKRILVVALSILTVACGGGGSGGGDDGGGGPASQGFGLSARPSLGAISLPTGGTGTSFTAVEAFPSLPASAFSQPVFVAGVPRAAADPDRVVVIEKTGAVKVFTNDPSVTTTRTILTVPNVETAGEQGLLGLAFDPNFTSNRFVYLYISRSSRSVVSRFRWDAATDSISPSSELVLITVPQPDPDRTNHKAGMIAFGPDGYLYIALGDGGGAGDPDGNGQDLSDLLANLLRIDVRNATTTTPYVVPPDNPFVADNNANTLGEIWAYGLRNPFRFSFDRQTGELWLGDVGQNEFEEVDIITKGGNFGWCPWEGNHDFAGCSTTLPNSAFVFPLLEYGRSAGASVTGGVVYRGSALPSLVGQYVYGDYVSGNVWALRRSGTTVAANTLLDTVDGPVAFGEDNDAEILIVALNNATIFRLEESGGGGGTVPMQLSETGIFTNTANLTPASGFVEYGINVPFWSDGATKRRWIAVPNSQRITFSSTDAWTFPVGTVIVKQFDMNLTDGDPSSARRLETRLLVRESTGWSGFVYKWNQAETDAALLPGGASETLTINTSSGTRTQQYDYPSRADCLQCHTTAAGSILGVRTRQMNRDFAMPDATDNQLRAFNHVNYFTTNIGAETQYAAYPDLTNTSIAVAQRARTYLEVNCAQCHRPSGPTGVALDLRVDTADAQMNAIEVNPQTSTLGITNARIIARGAKERSVLWERMRRLDGNRMPPLASHRADDAGVALVGAWIDSL